MSKPGVFWVERVPKLTPQPHAGTHERSPTSAPWLFSTWCDKADAEPKGGLEGLWQGHGFQDAMWSSHEEVILGRGTDSVR